MFFKGYNKTTKIVNIVSSRELHKTVIFVFNKNLVFVALFKKRTYRISLLFEIFYGIHIGHMKE